MLAARACELVSHQNWQLTGGGVRHSLNPKVTFCQVFVPYKKNFAKPKVQRTQGIEFFDSFNNFSSKQKLQQAKFFGFYTFIAILKFVLSFSDESID